MPNRDTRPLRGSRRSRPLPVAPLVALAILAVGIAYAQQNLPVPPTPVATTPESGNATPPAADAPASSAPEPAEAAPPPPTTGKGSPQRFEPTEKVRPDFDVAFPIDI